MTYDQIVVAGQILGLGLKLFLAAALLSRRGRRRDHSVAAAALFVADAFPGILQIPLMLAGAEAVAHSIWMLPAATPYLAVGPALYWYVRSLISPTPLTWRVIGRTEILLCAAGLALGLAAAVADTLRPPDPAAGTAVWVLLVAVVLAVFLLVVTLIVYTARAIRLAVRHRRNLEHHFSSIEGRTLGWVPFLVAALVVLIAQNLFSLTVVLLVIGGGQFRFELLQEWSSTALIFGFGLIVLRQEAVYEPSPRPVPAPAAPQAEAERYQRSALDAGRMERLAARIEAMMAADGLHRDHFLTLSDLAGAVGASEHHVSQVLNDRIGRNFFEYVNGHRIREACALLAGTDTSIVAIGEEVGFNSRSTFNAAFKKAIGRTPSQFRADARGAQPAASRP
jgi:AraC-like DNA-binding protein